MDDADTLLKLRRIPVDLGRQVLYKPHSYSPALDRLPVHVANRIVCIAFLLVFHEGDCLPIWNLDANDTAKLAEGLLQSGLLRPLIHARHSDSALGFPGSPSFATALWVPTIRAVASTHAHRFQRHDAREVGSPLTPA